MDFIAALAKPSFARVKGCQKGHVEAAAPRSLDTTVLLRVNLELAPLRPSERLLGNSHLPLSDPNQPLAFHSLRIEQAVAGHGSVLLEQHSHACFPVPHPDFALFLLRFERRDGSVCRASACARTRLREVPGPKGYSPTGRTAGHPSGYYNQERDTVRIDPCCGARDALQRMAQNLDRPNSMSIRDLRRGAAPGPGGGGRVAALSDTGRCLGVPEHHGLVQVDTVGPVS